MLSKLNKYENKHLYRAIFPIGIGVILVSILGSLLMKLNLSVGDWMNGNAVGANIIQSMATMFFGFSIFAIVSANFIAIFMIMQRYYKNLFTDEGYLTFTLPVKTREIILSKLICGILWEIFTMACTLIGVLIIAIFGSSKSFINHNVINAIKEMFNALVNLQGGNTILIAIELVVAFIVSLATQLLLIYLAITIGNQVARKRKVLASVGMYFVIDAACQTINTVLLLVIGVMFNGLSVLDNVEPTDDLFNVVMLFVILLAIIYCTVFFTINNRVLKNKLNIE